MGAGCAQGAGVRCERCKRPLTRFAVSVQTRDGVVGWGPDCARRVFREARKARAARPRAERDERTVDWVEGMNG